MNKLLYLPIPVEEELPEDNEAYLCFCYSDFNERKDPFMQIGHCHNKKWTCETRVIHVTHWLKSVSREEYDKALIQKLIPSFKPISINEDGSVMFLYQPVKQS